MRTSIKAGLSAAVLSAGLLAFPGTANAYPTYCEGKSYGTNGGTVYCYASASGTQFRAVVGCRHITSSGSADNYTVYGTWQTQGDPFWSNANCQAGDSVTSRNAGLR
jgi:hypothetical protein